MFTIYDYIKYYKNTKVADVKWNTADNLICSILCYLHIDSFEETINLEELCSLMANNNSKNDKYLMERKAREILKEIKKSERYKEIKISNFVNIRNNETQFGAITFRIDNITIVAYKGTDNSLIGWIENFRLLYIYPTYTQNLSIKYLKDNINLFKDNNVYVVGHSKGGNLAMTATMEAENYIYNKIVNVINFDGPGFLHEQFNSIKYKSLKEKLINIVPSSSIVGMLLENENYNVIKSSDIAWNQHYPTNWLMFGEYFVDNKISVISKEIHEGTSIKIRNLNKEKLRDTFEILYKNLNKEYSSNEDFTFMEIYQIYQNFKNIDPKVKKYLDSIINSILKAYGLTK